MYNFFKYIIWGLEHNQEPEELEAMEQYLEKNTPHHKTDLDDGSTLNDPDDSPSFFSMYGQSVL